MKNNVKVRVIMYIIGIALCVSIVWVIVPYQTAKVKWTKV